MNTTPAFEDEIVSEVLPKSIPFFEGEPFFMDFQTKMEDSGKYHTLKSRYVEKYLEF